MKQCISKCEGVDGRNKASILEMRKSILGWNLAVAAENTSSRNGNMCIIFEKIAGIIAAAQAEKESVALHAEDIHYHIGSGKCTRFQRSRRARAWT